jgi:ABC-type branched-subunit amino acid transport system permease subunit
MIVLIQESTRFLPDVPGYPNVVPALREIVIGAVLVLFLHLRPQGLLPIPHFRSQRVLERW